MKWVGLTGSIGSGKSSVGEILRRRGYPVVSADALAREAVQKGSPILETIVEEFGAQALSPEGDLDRQTLAELVFSQPKELQKLEALIHPEVRRLSRERRQSLEKQGHEMAFYDVPLLFEKNLAGDFDFVAVVMAPRDQQIERVQRRDGLSFQQIEARLNVQLEDAKKAERADFVLFNDKDFDHLESQVEALVLSLQRAQE